MATTVAKAEQINGGADENKPKKKMTASSVLKEFGLSVEELYDILNELYNELEKRNGGSEGEDEEEAGKDA